MNFDWLNENSRKFLSRGYLEPGKSPTDRIRDMAQTAEKLLDYPGFADKFYDYMGRGFYSLSSPVWSNFGNDRGLPISCNGVYVPDTIDGILEKQAEVGMQTKHGAGTSGYFGDIRPRGSEIKTGGISDGPIHFMNLFETTTDIISQGNVRRGSFAAYLDISHPDVEEFLEIREIGNSIQNMSIGLCISDEWMKQMITEGEAVKNGEMSSVDAKKLSLWARVMRKRKETGYPYIFFTDTVNRNKPQVLKDKNIPIYASNLCLKGDTKIKIKDADGEKELDIEDFVNLWNLGAFSDGVKVLTEKGYQDVTAAAQTGKSRKMIKITSDCGTKSVECTPEHQIFTKNRGWVEAQYLKEDDELDLFEK